MDQRTIQQIMEQAVSDNASNSLAKSTAFYTYTFHIPSATLNFNKSL